MSFFPRANYVRTEPDLWSNPDFCMNGNRRNVFLQIAELPNVSKLSNAFGVRNVRKSFRSRSMAITLVSKHVDIFLRLKNQTLCPSSLSRRFYCLHTIGTLRSCHNLPHHRPRAPDSRLLTAGTRRKRRPRVAVRRGLTEMEIETVEGTILLT